MGHMGCREAMGRSLENMGFVMLAKVRSYAANPSMNIVQQQAALALLTEMEDALQLAQDRPTSRKTDTVQTPIGSQGRGSFGGEVSERT